MVIGRSDNHIPFGPGKFEGESCITPLAHYWVMNGDGYSVEDSTDNLVRFDGPFTLEEVIQWEDNETPEELMCQECISKLLDAKFILCGETDQGFAYSICEEICVS